jgi:hypothetical protein
MSAVSSGKTDGFESEDESEIDFDLAILWVWEETLSFSEFKVSVILFSSKLSFWKWTLRFWRDLDELFYLEKLAELETFS